MNQVEQKLFSWHRLYVQLEEARVHLAKQETSQGPAQAELEAQVNRLQQESDRWLEELNAAVAQAKRQPCDNPPSPLCTRQACDRRLPFQDEDARFGAAGAA